MQRQEDEEDLLKMGKIDSEDETVSSEISIWLAESFILFTYHNIHLSGWPHKKLKDFCCESIMRTVVFDGHSFYIIALVLLCIGTTCSHMNMF